MIQRALLLVLVLAASTTVRADPPASDELAELSERLLSHPSDVEARVRRADTLLRMGEPNAALDDVREVEMLAPSDGRPALLRAGCLFALGRLDAAWASLDDAAIERAPFPAQALALRARIAVARHDDPSAIIDLDRALTVLADPDLFLLRADCAARLGETELQLDGLREGVLRTDAVVLEEALVSALEHAGRASEALAFVEGSGLPDIRRTLARARLLQTMGRDAEAQEVAAGALALIEASARRRPTAVRHLERALALAILSRCDEADAALRAADALSPRARALPGLASVAGAVSSCGGSR